MPMIGGGEPKYSVPEISYSLSSAAPAPRMLPVCGKPGIGTAIDLNLTVGTAAATPGNANRTAPTTARHVDALRITFLPSSFDGQVRLDPGRSGAMTVRRHRDPRHLPGNNGEYLTQT